MIFCGKETEKVLGKKLDDASIFPISLVIERARCYKLTVFAADLDKQQFKFLVDGKPLVDYEYLHPSRDLQIPLPSEVIDVHITVNGTRVLGWMNNINDRTMLWSITRF